MEPMSSPSSTSADPRLPEESALHPYHYQPLASRQIRLLALLPSQDSAAIGIRLTHADLPPTSNPEYQALSYVWGSSSARHPVHVLSDGDTLPSVMHVGDNLAGLLRRLRETESGKLLWIDAICINQTDNAEKSHQIPLMGDIYRSASRVIVWLGPERDESTRLAMEYMKRWGAEIQFNWDILKYTSSPDLARRQLEDPLLRLAVQRQFTREWFERLWVRQEIALARRAAIFCGRFEVDWEDFRSAMMLVVYFSREDALRLLSRVASFFRPHPIDWSGLSLELMGLKCSDPRDRIYGMLALIADDGISSLVVDYKLCTAEVYTLTAKHCLGNLKSNDTLLQCQLSSDRMANLPSWVPDWSTDPKFTPVTAGIMAAASRTRPFIEFREGGVMRLAGVASSRVKTVISLGQTPDDLTEGVIRVLGMFSSPHDDYTGGDMSVGEAIVYALLLGAYEHTIRPTNIGVVTEDDVRGTLRYFVALSKDEEANEPDKENHKRFLSYQAVTRWPLTTQNNAIILFEDGFIGIGPGVATPGDRLFFPLGSVAPLLVRRAVGSQWLVVCAAWVNGRMSGEIMYGPLPSNWGVVRVTRAGSLRKEMKIERLRDGPGECSADEAWSPDERAMKRFGVDNEEDLTPELLRSKGVPVEWLDFV